MNRMANLTGRTIWFFRMGDFVKLPSLGEVKYENGSVFFVPHGGLPTSMDAIAWQEGPLYLVNYEVRRFIRQDGATTFVVPWNSIDTDVYTSVNYGVPQD